MFLELIAAVASGFAGAGFALVINLISGGRLPRWVVPVMAGAAMLSYAIWSEYTWFDRTAAGLPESVEISFINEAKAMYKPWTYAVPFINRFAALDTASIQTNDNVPHQRIADLYFFSRWSPNQVLPIVVDCEVQRMAPLPSAEFNEAGEAVEAAWTTPAEGDTTLAAACA